jgi:transcriptional regulator with XRE-family HTH domain
MTQSNNPLPSELREGSISTPRRKLAELVKQRRKLLGISQDMLAVRMKATRPTVNQIENADSQVSADKMLRACEVLFIDPRELLDLPLYDDGART